MKNLILITLLLSLTSCGWLKRQTSNFTGNAIETCHKGVTYIQFPSGATVALDRKGEPLKCD